MSKISMTIHRALSELKTYDDRIRRAMQADFVQSNKKSNDKIKGKTIKEVEQQIQGAFQSYEALAENQRRIKAAVVLSNASTIVTIGGKKYSVAEAIERKAKIRLDEEFLLVLKAQFKKHDDIVERENSQLPDKLEKYLQSILGDKDKRSADDIASHTKAFDDRNKYELIDPCDIAKKISEYEQKIMNFKTEVDYALSESNATTIIEVELAD